MRLTLYVHLIVQQPPSSWLIKRPRVDVNLGKLTYRKLMHSSMYVYYFYHILQTNIAAYQEEREEADREVVQQPMTQVTIVILLFA